VCWWRDARGVPGLAGIVLYVLCMLVRAGVLCEECYMPKAHQACHVGGVGCGWLSSSSLVVSSGCGLSQGAHCVYFRY
jgi:hypothetical protein